MPQSLMHLKKNAFFLVHAPFNSKCLDPVLAFLNGSILVPVTGGLKT